MPRRRKTRTKRTNKKRRMKCRCSIKKRETIYDHLFKDMPTSIWRMIVSPLKDQRDEDDFKLWKEKNKKNHLEIEDILLRYNDNPYGSSYENLTELVIFTTPKAFHLVVNKKTGDIQKYKLYPSYEEWNIDCFSDPMLCFIAIIKNIKRDKNIKFKKLDDARRVLLESFFDSFFKYDKNIDEGELESKFDSVYYAIGEGVWKHPESF